jgi:hypothetical protein
MGEAWSTHGRGETCIQNAVRKPRRDRNHVEDIRRWEDDVTLDLRDRMGGCGSG